MNPKTTFWTLEHHFFFILDPRPSFFLHFGSQNYVLGPRTSFLLHFGPPNYILGTGASFVLHFRPQTIVLGPVFATYGWLQREDAGAQIMDHLLEAMSAADLYIPTDIGELMEVVDNFLQQAFKFEHTNRR